MADFNYNHVMVALARGGDPAPRRYRLGLGARDTAWNPASTKRPISGPATVTYTQYPDGGIDVSIGMAPQVGPASR
jgi:hypothetical protein